MARRARLARRRGTMRTWDRDRIGVRRAHAIAPRSRRTRMNHRVDVSQPLVGWHAILGHIRICRTTPAHPGSLRHSVRRSGVPGTGVRRCPRQRDRALACRAHAPLSRARDSTDRRNRSGARWRVVAGVTNRGARTRASRDPLDAARISGVFRHQRSRCDLASCDRSHCLRGVVGCSRDAMDENRERRVRAGRSRDAVNARGHTSFIDES